MCEICQKFNPFAGDWLHGDVAEDVDGMDAPAGRGTTLSLAPGRSLGGDLSAGDEDWVRLEVTAGETFTITTGDGASNPVKDTFLVLYDRNGNQIALDDDEGPGFHASLSYKATDSVYFAAVTTYQAHYGYPTTDEGTYTLSLTSDGRSSGGAALPHFSNDQIADKLVRGYWEDTGRTARGFDVSVDDGRSAVIHVDTSALTTEGQWFAERALEVWSAVSGITFSDAAPPSGSPVGIRFDDENSGAYTSTTLYDDGSIANAFVNVSKGWIAGDHYDFDSYALQTYIHEVGHALGLGHAGSYNTGEGIAITYADHAEFANDSWQTTIMSYFSQQENTTLDASRAYLMTPAPADILAIQSIYGEAGNLRTGNTVYGDNANGGGYFDNLEETWGSMAFTLVDDGGKDTLNVSRTKADQTIRLQPESVSDLDGSKGSMSIARGTIIENAISGSGDDRIEGNSAKNRLDGRAGADTLLGEGGGDTLFGRGGNDRLEGGNGYDKLYGNGGHDQLHGNAGNDKLFGGKGNDWLRGNEGKDKLTGGAGADTFVFTPGDGKDVVRDWEAGVDRLDLRAWDFDRIAELDARTEVVTKGLVIDFGGGDVLRILDRGLTEIPLDDVLL